MKWQYEEHITNQLLKQGIELPRPIRLEPPVNPDHGHYATNIAFQLAKTLKLNPKLLAEQLCTTFNLEKTGGEGCTFSALNGFVNLHFSDEIIWQKSRDFSPISFPKTSGKVLLEYVSANPTGPLHIGHGRWAVLGDVIFRLIQETGQAISTEFYINDAGNQIDKLIQSVTALRQGNPIPEDGYHGSYVQALANSIEDPVKQNLADQKKVLESFRVTFDTWFSEKSLYKKEDIKTVLETLHAKGFTYHLDGALWFKSTLWSDDKDRVLVKSEGAYTYFLVDLAYHFNKIQRGYTKLINIWGADHHGYVKRVKAGVSALSSDDFLKDDHFTILIGQLVNLFRNGEPVRMSKRTGDMITLEDVIEEIGVDATRFFLIEKSPDTHVEFDLALAAKQSAENPVYYIQYAHARLCSIRDKFNELPPTGAQIDDLQALSPEEKALLWHCLKGSDVVWESAQQLAPHHWVTYTVSLARKVQSFYEKSPILKASPESQVYRIKIVEIALHHLKYSLNLLGISTPERM